MLGVTGHSKSGHAQSTRLNAYYVMAFGLSAAVVASGAFLLSRVLTTSPALPAVAAAALLLFFAATDLRLGPLRTPGPRRQTDPAWRVRFGLPRATVLWGLDIGTTVTTIKMTSLYWAAFLVLLTGPGPQLHVVVLAFAAGYLVTHALVVWGVSRGDAVDAAVLWFNEVPAHARITSGVVLAGLGVVMLVQTAIG